MIEQLEDIVEELANHIGVYGACRGEHECKGNCRPCWTARLTARIENAVEIERKLTGASHES